MFKNPGRGRQAINFTTNVPKILDLKLSSAQIFSENWRWVPPFNEIIFFNHDLFSQIAASEEQASLLTSSLFRKRPLVVIVKRMLHQEIKLRNPQLKFLGQKTPASVKSQNPLVIQVNNSMICFPCYCLLADLKGRATDKLLEGAFFYRRCYRYIVVV